MELHESHKKDRHKAILGTIIFHAVLALIFLFYGLKEPHPPRKEKMVSIDMNYGTSLKGQGQVESKGQKAQKSTQEEKQESEQQQQEEPTSQDMATQDQSPVNAQDREDGDKKGDRKKQTQKKEQKVNEDLKQAQQKLQEMDAEQGGGEGNDQAGGNEGNPQGKTKGQGSLPGAGGSWKLSGRKILQKPQPDEPNEEGKVVVDIWVDQQGKVIRTSPNLRKSNTTSDKLLKLAQEAARKARFNPDPNGAVEQKGQFTFVFELQ
ncbi:MAG: energy transducer TonB [Flavobacteriales bacterium]